jgi:hypothetical protein
VSERKGRVADAEDRKCADKAAIILTVIIYYYYDSGPRFNAASQVILRPVESGAGPIPAHPGAPLINYAGL